MFGVRVWRKGRLVTHEINPTWVLDVITEGTGQRSYTPLQGWRLEVCSPAILINGQGSHTSASVSGWTVHYANTSWLRPVLVMIRGI